MDPSLLPLLESAKLDIETQGKATLVVHLDQGAGARVLTGPTLTHSVADSCKGWCPAM